ncbi:hypothetical protein GCM10009081_24340 [Brevundimonas nasdae]
MQALQALAIMTVHRRAAKGVKGREISCGGAFLHGGGQLQRRPHRVGGLRLCVLHKQHRQTQDGQNGQN